VKPEKSTDAADLRRRAQARLQSQTPPAKVPGSANEMQRLLQELHIHQIELEIQDEELRETRARLEASTERYTDLYDFAPVGYFTLGHQGEIIQSNLAGARLLGLGRSRLLNCRFEAFVAIADRPSFRTLLTRAFATQSPDTIEVQLAIKDKPPLTVILKACVSEDGRESRFVLTDITERKRVEEGLRESETRLDQLAEQSRTIAWEVNAAGLYTYVNHVAELLLGYRPEELVGRRHFYDLHPEIGREEFKQAAFASFERKERFADLINVVVTKDGRLRWVSTNGIPILNRDGTLRGYSGSDTDVTERKRAEGALMASEEKHRLLFENAGDVIIIIDEKGQTLDANRVALKLLGYTRPELMSMTIHQIDSPEDRLHTADRIARLRQEGNLTVETCVQCKDGSLIPIEVNARRIVWDGEPAFLGICRDLTERKQAEERLRQAQKMEAIGRLTGGMAHEFNNILAAMLMNVELVQSLNPGAEAGELLTTLEGSCQRAAGLIKQLLAFSRQSVMRRQPMDLAAAVSKQGKILGRLLGERITLELSIADKLPWVNADMGMVEQVLLNLCLNARDAMKDGGLLRLCLRDAELVTEQTKAHVEAAPGSYVCLSVTDTGCGMDDRTLQRLFEPFFTTKDVGQGTGLGLATVRGIVQQLGGWVDVESCVGKGSTFRVCLPAVAQPSAAPLAPQTEKPVPGKRTILLVEDEPGLRRPVRMLLERIGYTVLEAADGNEALALWRKHPAEINLVYTDVVMPGGPTGIELADQMLAEEPGVKVIITSGYNADTFGLANLTGTSRVFVPKPCPAPNLLSLIQKCLQQA